MHGANHSKERNYVLCIIFGNMNVVPSVIYISINLIDKQIHMVVQQKENLAMEGLGTGVDILVHGVGHE